MALLIPKPPAIVHTYMYQIAYGTHMLYLSRSYVHTHTYTYDSLVNHTPGVRHCTVSLFLLVCSVNEVTERMFQYFCYGTGCVETEIDVLTGETQILRADILYDCGQR